MLASETFLPARDYHLAATLTSGQAFGWQFHAGAWEGVIGSHWVRLRQAAEGLLAVTAAPVSDWGWLVHYLQSEVDLNAVLMSFPADEPMRASIAACRGLRLLRQDPWECLASFILSSSKQIVQIQQITAQMRSRFGAPVPVPPGHEPAFAFPAAETLAAASEADLRACKMGFRAPNLLATAQMVANGEVDLPSLRARPVDEARRELLKFPGVGEKIADCVLLFAYGFERAFPLDVWVSKALRQLYFLRRRPDRRRLRHFTATHFGANAGYAQQYLFHYIRTGGRGKDFRGPSHSQLKAPRSLNLEI